MLTTAAALIFAAQAAGAVPPANAAPAATVEAAPVDMTPADLPPADMSPPGAPVAESAVPAVDMTPGAAPAAAATAPPDMSPATATLPDTQTTADIAQDDRVLSGFVEVEGRAFTSTSDDGIGKDAAISAAIEPTLRWDSADGRHSLRLTGFARIDNINDHRTHADVREAKWVGQFGKLNLVVGVDRMFWGVTEAAHVVNIVNQIDALEDIDREDFLGQPLASAALNTSLGTFSAYVMPMFRERRFPGAEDRPNLPLPVARKLTRYESSKGDDHVDWAARWQINRQGLDVGLSYFSGTDRDPQLMPTLTATGRPVLAPYYALIDQAGIDAQWSLGSLALKFEGMKRWTTGKNYGALATGVEYTIGGIGAGGGDLGLLAEYLWNNGRGRGPSPFEDDIMVGLRWSGNDAATTELLAAAVFDVDGHGTAFNIEGSRRMGKAMRVSIDARLFTNGVDDQLRYIRDDSFVQVKLQYYF